MKATVPVSPGQVLTVVVGTAGGGIGYGARSSQENSPGGGLVGVFSGAQTAATLSQDNSLLIAGGFMCHLRRAFGRWNLVYFAAGVTLNC
eukprot:m.18055 g.18055  ORF g.18055 m.18055 type:complete len:90 (+) comp11372_c1_seq4:455-724(+)